MKFKLALLAGLALAGANAMACYTVYDANARVLYQGADTPVDMSMQLHEALAARGFPAGSRMQFDRASCATVPVAMGPSSRDLPPNTIRISKNRPEQRVAQGPLLTEPGRAASLGMPHAVIANNIAVVSPANAVLDRSSAVTVVPAETVARVSSTNTMGAGPAYATRTMGAAPARMLPAPSRNITVITEYRNGDRTVQRY
ncbi:hypothetical protein LZ009_09080 [Ramlibacter sp. XY19]|uniref:hypothetical protein n=1 Tax=Ramlibacter paludis TaxID=2908000 RepID=UPI0023DCB123|nr:hypothetical protein [Ramlibacter paludis]MCG2592932.1 hypothetical protein [Ramlibacter paludis]